MDIINCEEITTVIGRTLNLVDPRLMDHGRHVAMVLGDMLKVDGCRDLELRKNLKIMALLHDIGAYRTDEIDNMVRFEMGDIWDHSIYGYLFLREFAPLGELAQVVLYHHASCAALADVPEDIARYAQMLHIADRAVVWYDTVHDNKENLRAHFEEKKGSAFYPECVDLLWEADRRFDTFERLANPDDMKSVMDRDAVKLEEAKAYLKMVIYSVDFRSRVTVTQTISVGEIAVALAEQMGLPDVTRDQIRYGALLHDIGKIGTPLSILEKPGRLTDEEMAVMRQHVLLTDQIISGCVDDTVARIAVRHHEKLNGKGYPLGLSGEELTLPERILAVADVVSALCMSRSYKEAFPKERCLSILHEMASRGESDPEVIRVMEENYDEILRQANQACEPLKEVYDRMVREYVSLLNMHDLNHHVNPIRV